MDRARARSLARRLAGISLEGWTIGEYLNHGKSAAVFKAMGFPRKLCMKIVVDVIDAEAEAIECVAKLDLAEQVANAVPTLVTQLTAYPRSMIGVLCPRVKDVREVFNLLANSEVSQHVQLQLYEDGYEAIDPERPILCSTIHGTKGLEFRAVHLLALGTIAPFTNAPKLAYTAVTRAKTSLSLCLADQPEPDPDELRRGALGRDRPLPRAQAVPGPRGHPGAKAAGPERAARRLDRLQHPAGRHSGERQGLAGARRRHRAPKGGAGAVAVDAVPARSEPGGARLADRGDEVRRPRRPPGLRPRRRLRVREPGCAPSTPATTTSARKSASSCRC